jgi:hypothetical protein
MDKGGNMNDADSLSLVRQYIKEAKNSKIHPLALPSLLDLEHDMKKVLKEIDAFKKTTEYAQALKSADRYFSAQVIKGNKMSKEELNKTGDKDWHETNKRYLYLIKKQR